MRRTAVAIGLVMFTAVAQPSLGQEPKREPPKDFGWDLSYHPLLKKNGIGPDEYVAHWLKGTDRTFTHGLLAQWRGKRITASILIEHPAFHAAEHSILWLIRTDDKAFFWTAVDKRGFRDPEQQEIKPSQFDDILKSISSMHQANPQKRKVKDAQDLSGFCSFLSLYEGRGCRQMLLTFDDFYVEGEGGGRGRLLIALERIEK